MLEMMRVVNTNPEMASNVPPNIGPCHIEKFNKKLGTSGEID